MQGSDHKGGGTLRMTGQLMAGRRGLVMGVANDHSIAWGIARALAAHGAEMAFTYQGDAFGRRVKPLAESVGSKILLPCDVTDPKSLDQVFAVLKDEWGTLDFVVHAIAHSDKSELKGRYVDTSRENFLRTMDISCYSFTDVARRAAALMTSTRDSGCGGAMVTLTYEGSTRVMPNYNVMGVAKAALEASVKYIAADLGRHGIRVNAISAGPMRTLAGSAIGDARFVFKWNKQHAALKESIELDHVGGAGLYLLSDLSARVTGEVHHVDGGYNIIGMPRTDDLREAAAAAEAENGNGHARDALKGTETDQKAAE